MNNSSSLGTVVVGWAVVAAMSSGCSRAPTTQDPPPEAAAPALTQSPLIGIAAGDEKSFGGVATERLAAGPYLYFAVDNGGARRWVATLRTSEAKVGDWVSVNSFGVRENFVSKRLDRTFERVHFGIVRRQSDEARASQEETRP